MKHPNTLRYLLCCAIPGLFALSAACSSGSTSQTGGPEADGGSSSSADGAADGATVAPLGPKETCAKYIQCVSEVKPDLAGPLVSVYGEASTCWQGSLADSEACGRACASSDSVPGCKPIALKRHYAAYCVSSGGRLWFDAEVNYDGERGDITMKLLQRNPATYEPSFSLVDVPTIALKRAALGGRGESTTFNAPAQTFSASSMKAVSLEVAELREKESRICSSMSYGEEGSSGRERANCVYLPLTAGDPWPKLDDSKVQNCE